MKTHLFKRIPTLKRTQRRKIQRLEKWIRQVRSRRRKVSSSDCLEARIRIKKRTSQTINNTYSIIQKASHVEAFWLITLFRSLNQLDENDEFIIMVSAPLLHNHPLCS